MRTRTSLLPSVFFEAADDIFGVIIPAFFAMSSASCRLVTAHRSTLGELGERHLTSLIQSHEKLTVLKSIWGLD